MYNKTMLSTDTVKNLKNSPAFVVFQDHILEKMSELDSIQGFDEMSNKEAGETSRVNATALKVLVKILDPVLNFQEKKEVTKEQIQEKKDKAGL